MHKLNICKPYKCCKTNLQMIILAPHFCTQQTVTLNDTNPSKYLSRLGYSL